MAAPRLRIDTMPNRIQTDTQTLSAEEETAFIRELH